MIAVMVSARRESPVLRRFSCQLFRGFCRGGAFALQGGVSRRCRPERRFCAGGVHSMIAAIPCCAGKTLKPVDESDAQDGITPIRNVDETRWFCASHGYSCRFFFCLRHAISGCPVRFPRKSSNLSRALSPPKMCTLRALRMKAC